MNPNSIDYQILNAIRCLGQGAVFVPTAFLSFGSRQAVDIFLHRLLRRQLQIFRPVCIRFLITKKSSAFFEFKASTHTPLSSRDVKDLFHTPLTLRCRS